MTNDLVEKENLVEIGCLYAINESKPAAVLPWQLSCDCSCDPLAAEHVRRYVKEKHDAVEEFEKQCSKDEKVLSSVLSSILSSILSSVTIVY